MCRVVTLAIVGLAVIGVGAIVHGQAGQTPTLLPEAQASQTVTWSIDLLGPRTNWAGSMVRIHVLDEDELGGINPLLGPNLEAPLGIPTIVQSQAGNSNAITFTLWHTLAPASGINLTANEGIRELDIQLHVHGSDTAGNDGLADVEATFFDIFHLPGNAATFHRPQNVSVYVTSAITTLGQFEDGNNLANPGTGHWLLLPGTQLLQITNQATRGLLSLFWKTLESTTLAADIQHGAANFIPEPVSFAVWGCGALCGVIGLAYRRRRVRS